MAWIYEFGIGHFLEFTKVLKQTKQGSYLQLVKGIMSKKGIVGVWDGFFPWGSIQAIAKGRRVCVCIWRGKSAGICLISYFFHPSFCSFVSFPESQTI